MIVVFIPAARNAEVISFLFFIGSNGALLQVLTGSYFSEKIPKVWLLLTFLLFYDMFGSYFKMNKVILN